MTIKTPPESRFWKKVLKSYSNACWPWLGWTCPKGYGHFTPHPRKKEKNKPKSPYFPAHRLAWEYTFKKKVPKGLEACHSCDNRACCNPKHIWIGTHRENMADMKKKGRAFKPKGELHGEAKLTDKEVKKIRRSYIPNVVSLNMLARQFNVSKKLILLVIQRRAWSHVT